MPSGPEARPLFKVRPEGGLEVASRGTVFVRKGCVAWYSGKIRFVAEPSFRGTSLERILRCDGRGDPARQRSGAPGIPARALGPTLFVEGSRLLALDHGLTFRLDAIQDFRRNRRVDFSRSTAAAASSSRSAGRCSPTRSRPISRCRSPRAISSPGPGDLVASVLDDQFLEEVMQPDIASPPKIRFEGEGVVLTEPPRPRRRASDADRPVGQRRN